MGKLIQTAPIANSQQDSKVKLINIDINDACRLKCKFCYNWKFLSSGRSIPAERYKSIINRFPLLGEVGIGGGEPMLHRELLPMLDFTLQKNIRTMLATSATVWKQEIIRMGKEFSSLFSVQISLPAGTQATYLEMTGRDDFGTALENFRKMLDGIGPDAFTVRFTICKENLKDLNAVADIAGAYVVPMYVGLLVPMPGLPATRLEPKEISLVSYIVDALRTSGQNISFLGRKKGETRCHALSLAYGFSLTEGGCPAYKGEQRYFDAGENEKGCEFLNGGEFAVAHNLGAQQPATATKG